MSARNNCTFIGNICADAETKYTKTGKAYAVFTLGTSYGWGDNKKSLFVRCKMWGSRAEGGLIEHLTKGRLVAVTGELGVTEWQGNDGKDRYCLDLNLSDVSLLDSNGGQRRPQQPQQQPSHRDDPFADNGSASDDDDIPF